MMMLSDKARRLRCPRTGHVELYHTIVLCHRRINRTNSWISCITLHQTVVRNFLRFDQDGGNVFVLKNFRKWIGSVPVECPDLEDAYCPPSPCLQESES